MSRKFELRRVACRMYFLSVWFFLYLWPWIKCQLQSKTNSQVHGIILLKYLTPYCQNPVYIAVIFFQGPRHFERSMTCQYCYQTPSEKHTCSKIGHCNSAANPVQRYRSNCTVKSNILCLGKRNFPKNVRCNWTSGYRWSTTLFLSITLGGFGADRFYLGHWQVCSQNIYKMNLKSI